MAEVQHIMYMCKLTLRARSHGATAKANFYRPQRSCGQGNVFTGVCDSVNRGVSASVHAGIPPPPQEGGTPLGRRHPRKDAPHPPPMKENPTPRNTVNERPVRILLECILVFFDVCK